MDQFLKDIIKEYSQEVEVVVSIPSGKMVFNNVVDFYLKDRWIDLVHDELTNHKKEMEFAGKVGIFYATIGNTSASVYKKGNFLTIGNKKANSKVSFGKKVGTIHSEGWAYAIADYDDYVKKGGDPKTKDIIHVKPGRYLLKHKVLKESNPEIFSTIEKTNRKPKKWITTDEKILRIFEKQLRKKYKMARIYVKIDFDPKQKSESPLFTAKLTGFQVTMGNRKKIGKVNISPDQVNKKGVLNAVKELVKDYNRKTIELSKIKLTPKTKAKILKMLKKLKVT